MCRGACVAGGGGVAGGARREGEGEDAGEDAGLQGCRSAGVRGMCMYIDERRRVENRERAGRKGEERGKEGEKRGLWG